MKEKRLKTILLPLVLLIWGLTIYRYFFDSPDPSGDMIATAPNKQIEFALHSEENKRDTFSLLPGYPDPFLSGASNRAKFDRSSPNRSGKTTPYNRATSPKPRKRPSKQVRTTVNWAQFQYQGLISQSQGEHQVALLSHNGKLQSVEVGGHYRQIEVLKIGPDSIWLRYQGEENSISR